MKTIENFEKWLKEEINAQNNDSMDDAEFVADYNNIEEIQNAADNGDGNACYLLAKLNCHLYRDESEDRIVKSYTKKGVEIGNRYCIVNYCEMAMCDDLNSETNEEHIKSLISLLEPLVDVSAHANYVLGMIYFSVPSCFQDREKAAYYMRRAADNCDYDAIYEMQMWDANKFVSLDVGENYFFNALLKSADKGDKRAMHVVANYYHDGYGCEKNLDKAFEYADKAAKAGNGMSYLSLGYLYLNGYGTEVDIDKAVECYKTAGYMGFNEGYYTLGKMYYFGECVPKDIKLAMNYLYCAMNFDFDWEDDVAVSAAELVLKIAKETPEAVDEETLDLAKWYCRIV